MFETVVHFWWQLLIVAAGSALVGSINFSILFSHLFKKADVRDYGSGNPGTTNMFRVFGLKLGALTFVFDALKGFVPCLVAKLVFQSFQLEQNAVDLAMFVAAVCAVLGHVFPVYYGFKGGKGVATSMGAMLCIDPLLMLCIFVPFVVLVLITDRMSVVSILYAVFGIVWAWVVYLPNVGVVASICVTLTFATVLFAHRHNMVRIVKGHELPTGVRRALRGKSTSEYDKSKCDDAETQQ